MYYKGYWKTLLCLVAIATIIGLGFEFIEWVNEVPPTEYNHFYKQVGY